VQKRGRDSVKLILRKLYRVCFQIVSFAVETLAMVFYSNISCISISYIPCNILYLHYTV